MSDLTDREKELIEKDTGKTQYLDNKDPFTPLSRYNKIRYLLNNDNIPIQESWELEDIPESALDIYFKITAEFAHRLDLISLKFYNTEQLYWVIAFANYLIDPFAETIPGKVLRIPPADYVFQNILNQRV